VYLLYRIFPGYGAGNGEWVSLCVQHILVQRQDVIIREYKVEVFKSFRQKEGLQEKTHIK